MARNADLEHGWKSIDMHPLLFGACLVAKLLDECGTFTPTPLERAYGNRWHPAWAVLVFWIILMVM